MTIKELNDSQELMIKLDDALQAQYENLIAVRSALEKYRSFLRNQIKKYREN